MRTASAWKTKRESRHASAGDHPRDESAIYPGLGREPSRQLNHASADHRADDHRRQGWKAQPVMRLVDCLTARLANLLFVGLQK